MTFGVGPIEPRLAISCNREKKRATSPGWVTNAADIVSRWPQLWFGAVADVARSGCGRAAAATEIVYAISTY